MFSRRHHQVIRVGVYLLERRAAAVAVKLASPVPPPAAPQSAFSSLLSRVYSSPSSNDPHVDRIRSDRLFYGWLERRFADYMQGVVGLQVVAPRAPARAFLNGATVSFSCLIPPPCAHASTGSRGDRECLGCI